MKASALTPLEVVEMNAHAELRLFSAMSVDQVVCYLAEKQLIENAALIAPKPLTHRDPP